MRNMPFLSIPIPVLLIWVIWVRQSQSQSQAQSLEFSNVPESINEGAEIFISWTGGDGMTVRSTLFNLILIANHWNATSQPFLA